MPPQVCRPRVVKRTSFGNFCFVVITRDVPLTCFVPELSLWRKAPRRISQSDSNSFHVSRKEISAALSRGLYASVSQLRALHSLTIHLKRK